MSVFSVVTTWGRIQLTARDWRPGMPLTLQCTGEPAMAETSGSEAPYCQPLLGWLALGSGVRLLGIRAWWAGVGQAGYLIV